MYLHMLVGRIPLCVLLLIFQIAAACRNLSLGNAKLFTLQPELLLRSFRLKVKLWSWFLTAGFVGVF